MTQTKWPPENPGRFNTRGTAESEQAAYDANVLPAQAL